MQNHLLKIAKIISNSGYCSRREAEKLVLSGCVKINNEQVLSPATRASKDDVILVNGFRINTRNTSRLWMYNKPRGVICTHKDDKDRPTIITRLKELLNLEHIICVGRLDINSEGLILVTNDGDLANKLMLPKNNYERTYKVRAFGEFDMNEIHSSIKNNKSEFLIIDGINYRKPKIELIKDGRNSWFEIKINEGKNREVRKILEYFNLKVSRLIRTKYGPFSLNDLEADSIVEVKNYSL